MKHVFTLLCLFMCLILTGCVGNNSNPTQMETMRIPTLVPYYFHAESATPEELFSKLDEFTYPMGDKNILQTLLFNQHLESLQKEIHKIIYINWADETVQHKDAIETIDIYFHPKEYCPENSNNICSVNEEATKLYVRVFYKPGMWVESDFLIEGFEAVDQELTIFKGNEEDGKTTQFYYFVSAHYVCLLSVDTEYMNENSNIVEQFQKFCLSVGQGVVDS